MLNHSNCTVEGFITQELTVKTTRSGKKLCIFSLAIPHYSMPGEAPKVSFLEVEMWNEIAEKNEELKKGTKIMVSGVLRQNRWEDEKGKISSRIKIIANEIRVF